MTGPDQRDRRDDWPSEMRRPEGEQPHAYDRACRNSQHSGCTCMHPIDGRWCGRERNDPIHTDEQATSDGATRLAVEIAAHHPVDVGTGLVCIRCKYDWPCPVRRLTAERDNLAERLDWQKHKRGQVEADRDAVLAEVDALKVAGNALAEALAALLSHFQRHTERRCEIDRDAGAALDGWRAVVPDGGGDDGQTD